MASHLSSAQEASCMTADRSTRRTTDGDGAARKPTRRPAASGSGEARAGKSTARRPPTRTASNKKQATLAIDVGGTGLKASVLDPSGAMEVSRVRVDTSYPCAPTKLVESLPQLLEPLPVYDRVSVGFPGMVRDGRVLSAPHFVTVSGPGSETEPDLVEAWSSFDLAAALEAALQKRPRGVDGGDLGSAAGGQGWGGVLGVPLG